MSANRSTAVMQRKRPDGAAARGRDVAPSQLNYFPTPPWATRALCEFLITERSLPLDDMTCWEPACGEGHMTRPLQEYFADVVSSDVHRFQTIPGVADHEIFDFTLCGMLGHGQEQPDFVITNPPFTLAAEFIASASAVARHGFALLVRSAFLESEERFRRIWSVNPPSFVLQFSDRVMMLENRLIRRGAVDPFAAEPGGKVTSATAYCWLLWLDGEADTRMRWLAPSMERLEREGDYPDYASTAATESDGLFGAEMAA